ncbi:MAG: TRAP transporter large permease [Chloroflexi bacterium]|nr:TRAP transporter large permease [Chloroflexota bacterium]
MEWQTAAIVLFAALIFLMVLGMPLAFSLGLVGLVGLYFLAGPDKMKILGNQAVHFGTNYVLSPVPLFILMAEVIMFSGLSKDAFDAINKWFGRMPGGLAVSSQVACGAFAAVTGSSVANAATIGTVAIPEMLRHGYDKKLAVGAICAGGTVGVLIPPSIIMIIYAMITEESVGHLFMAGVIPGILQVVFIMALIMFRCRRNPSLAPQLTGVPWKDRIRSLWMVLPLLALALAVLIPIYAGIVTPTEAAGVGAAGAFIIALSYRRLTWGNLKNALLGAVRTTSFLLFVIIGAMTFGFLLSYLEIPQKVSGLIISLQVNRYVIMIGVMLLWFLLGCFLDPSPILLITMPVIYPFVLALGFDPIWFGIMATINMEVANITPPVGFNLFVVKNVAAPYGVTLDDVIRGMLPFIPVFLGLMALLMVFPQLALWLPGTMRK